jgi:two-component system OmpR family sensor kinase
MHPQLHSDLPAGAQPAGPGEPPATPAPADGGQLRQQPFGRGTLGRQLLLRVVLIVAGIAVLLCGASVLATQRVLMSNADNQLNAVVARQMHGGGGQPAANLLQPGQPVGTLYALYLNGRDETPDSGLLTTPQGDRIQRTTLPEAVTDRLEHFGTDRSHHTVLLPGLGRYRVAAYPAQVTTPSGQVISDAKLVVGISLADVDRVLTRVLAVAAFSFLLAVVGAVIAVQAVVKRSLRPLNRVASTAQQVSQLQLDRGEVALAMRVPDTDADPVSEVGRVGQALNHLLDNVDGALAARQASETKLKQFIADASHELRNPLASIRGYAELTRRGRDQLPSDTAYALGRVESEATRMSRLVEDLLLLARLDSGPNIEVGPVDPAELLINAVSDARAAGPDHHWVLDLDQHTLGAGSATVIGDRYRLHQAVVNLLANARTHTPPGTTVRVGLHLDGPDAVISVADDGPGIPPDIQGQVFERFTRADTSRARQGDGSSGSTGLGLAIVAAVAEAHHGSVRVQSVPGDTRFTLRLPLAAAG